MSPNALAPSWHYIDCDVGSIIEYSSGTGAIIGDCVGAVYSPIQNRVYMIAGDLDYNTWAYVDCATNIVNVLVSAVWFRVGRWKFKVI